MANIRIVETYGSIEKTFIQPLNELSKGPDFKTIGKLEAELAAMFVKTQAVVHIITGSLRASGKTSSDYDATQQQWSGTLSYGGPSFGVHNPVRYAWYEQRRGGSHDFMREVPLLFPAIGEIMLSFFSEKLG